MTPGVKPAPSETPYADLSPERMLDAIEAFIHRTETGVRCTGALFPLNSYENRVVIAALDSPYRGQTEVVAKFYRPGRWSDATIREEHSFARDAATAGIDTVAPWPALPRQKTSTLFAFGGHRLSLFPKRGGRPFELNSAEDFRQIGRLVGRLHALGAVRPFRRRPALMPESYSAPALDAALKSRILPADLKPNYRAAGEALLDAIATAWFPAAAIRLHGDLHLGNVLVDATGPFLVDLDDCCMGPAVQDLWMLLSGDAAEQEAQCLPLLSGYETFFDFDRREIALIEPLRAMRMLRHNGWLADRWADPAFPRAFPYAATSRYWQDQITAYREQAERIVPQGASELPEDQGPIGWEWDRDR
ncbi:MAG: serine/threonine protein kinase [Alphaproteobacteria bacterium]